MAKKPSDKPVDDPIRLARDYAWLLSIAERDPSMMALMRDLQAYLPTVKGDKKSVTTWMEQRLPATEWAKQRTSFRQQAEIEQSDPRFKQDWERSMQDSRSAVADAAAQLGVTVDPQDLEDLALEARYEKLDAAAIQRRLRPFLAADLAAGDDMRGNAGDFQTALQQWAAENGLPLGRSTDAYVQRMTLGEQTLDDVKQELRQTYMAGMFPAWADKINAGMDIADLAAPYKRSMANLLEVDDSAIGWDDPLLNAGLQATNADGKPVMMPLYEYQNMVRKDPRWQKTDNAYSTYTGVAQNLLRTFGFA